MLPLAVPVSLATMFALPSMVTTTILPAVLPVLVMPLVPKMVRGVPNGQVSLGASLRDRATLPSPLRGLGPSGGYPSRLRSLRSLRAPLARRLAALAAVAGPTRPVLHSTAPSTAPPCPPRDGAARRARRGSTPCAAGVGFAVHRLAHCPVQSCPHKCGHHRHRLRQRAAHDCLRLCPHRRPLTRRGGSPPPASPASIPRTSMLPIWPSRPPGRPWFSHPTHR